jgi:predicted metal-dependent hydrolase
MSIQIALDNGEIARLDIKRKASIKNVTLRADIYGMQILSPVNYSNEVLIEYLNNKKRWILKMVNYFSTLKAGTEFESLTKNNIFYLGKKYRLVIVKDIQEEVIVSDNLSQITFHVKNLRNYKDNIINWYKGETKTIIQNILPILSNKLSIDHGKISIKNQRSRWGSCSKKGNLNFNLLLASFSLDIIKYVITHEYCHILEFNHSKKFWMLVGSIDENYIEHRNWLKKYGSFIRIN